MAGIGYRFIIYRRLKDWLWNTFVTKLMPARADYFVRIMPDIELGGWGLDIGCGDGLVTSKIDNKYKIEMVGIDRAKPDSYTGTFILSDATRLPFENGVFSLVTCFSLIEHIRQEQRAEFYREIDRVLSQHGFLVIQHPNRFFPIEHHSYLPLIGYLPSRFHGIFHGDYCRIPSKNKLLADLRSAGFTVERLDSLGAPYVPRLKFLSKIKIFGLFPIGYLITMRKS